MADQAPQPKPFDRMRKLASAHRSLTRIQKDLEEVKIVAPSGSCKEFLQKLIAFIDAIG